MRSDEEMNCLWFACCYAFILFAWFDELARIGMEWVAGRTHSVFRGGIILCFDCHCPTSYTPFPSYTIKHLVLFILFPSRFHFTTSLITRRERGEYYCNESLYVLILRLLVMVN